MSDGPERSYYEIALTNRQVLTAFVILLSSVVLAFVSGLWVGRQAAERSLNPPVVTAQASPGEGTYRFFDGNGEGSPPATVPGRPPAAAPRPASREPATGERSTGTPPVSSPPAAAQEPKPVVPPPTETARPLPSPAPPPPAPSPHVATPVAPGPPPSEPSPPEQPRRRTVDPPATSELSVIQVFSTPEEAQARAVLDRLLSGSFKAFLSPVQVDGRTMYRVRVGPFARRAQAEAEAKKLRERYKLDTWITN